ncbi:E3 ubiquitin-protein ligase TRIM33-like [Mya arenaria]|uniref:E3 ubiquitin-protein ligase TRIM33-like n=1 Tax=Mya arenaria TaxID=6604 RepID=UPI0022E26EF8|nr:E3 ubiquitin-protein ligase TRIM33-like [Mya arenaria]XP_052811789.1 E3 ubiquitin-protein ligase TRIM33-like [Mya arenaria]XP_052811790.1 E3 ubiquitin-protein ligase TRIM33-like [Mya arenaria]
MDQVPGKKLQVDASALDITYCQPCSQDDEYIPAEAYCTVCKEFMCDTCTSVHKKQRMSKSHTLLDKSSMPTTMQGFTTKEESKTPCDIHPEECIKYFCPTHQTLNCGHCVVLEHQSCKQEIISKIAKAFKEGKAYKAIKQVIVQLLKDIDACASNVEENTKLVKYIGEQEIAKIKNYRDQINKYFDEREQTLLEIIAEVKQMDEILLKSLKPKCDNLKAQVGEIKAKLEAQENNTSQLFIEAHISKNLLEGLQLSLAEIKKNNTIQQYQIRKDPGTESLLGSRTGLGTFEEIDTSQKLGQRCGHSRRSTSQSEGEKIPATSDPAFNVKAVRDENTTTSDASSNTQVVADIQATKQKKKIKPIKYVS